MSTPRQELARNCMLARAAIASGATAAARTALDEFNMLCIIPEEDPDGKKRVDLLEQALDWLGEAAQAVELAQEEIDHIDPTEGEPEIEDEEEGEEEEGAEDDDGEEEDDEGTEEVRKPRRRRA